MKSSQASPVLAEPAAETAEDLLPPASSVGYLVRQTHRAFMRSLQARIAPHGVSIGMWYFLRALWEEDGISQRELSQRVGMMEPTTASALTAMERKGFVRRVRNRADRRIVNVFLTERGRALRERLLPLAAEVNRVALRDVTGEELTRLRLILTKLGAGLDADPERG
ncbi:MAG TPA: MarR family winged helix-turn-helix transcriptional regulator [Stellaceae bacterium]|nr:MarR family winged helix-turn-helix transcriptional regulator [Stellaceae bacterium]